MKAQTHSQMSWLESLKREPAQCSELDEDRIWSDTAAQVWETRHFIGSPSFSPVYRWQDCYSFSPLPLLLRKGFFELDTAVANRIDADGRLYLSSNGTLDQEIKRVGGARKVHFRIRTPADYAKAVGEALKKDIARIEAAYPDHTNVVLCGGKDSLNLLFLPWKKPVLVASGEPNFSLVQKFIPEHGLPNKLVKLGDDDSMLSREILINFCRNNLAHCRWGPSLTRLAAEHSGKVIFWKGQMGSILMSPNWMKYTDPAGNDWAALKRICSAFGHRGEYRIRNLLKSYGFTQRRTFANFWRRGAMWQGAHVSFIRQLTGALTLSAYHGPEMRKVIDNVDMYRSVPYDMRPLVGEYLYGGPVNYPKENPCPPTSSFRSGVSDIASFLKILQEFGIPVRTKGARCA